MSDIRFNRWLHQSGTGGIYQDANGNIGIGTSVPRSALDVQTGFISVGGNVLSSSGVSTFTDVSTSGLNVTGVITATTLKVGTGVTISAGIISATEFRGNGSNLTGVEPFTSGTLMLFQQTAAPTGWTKQTTHNDKTLRVVSGSASSGGTTAFTSVFASRTPAGSVSVSGSNSGGSVSAFTLTTSEMPSHRHDAALYGESGGGYFAGGSGGGAYSDGTGYTNYTGSSNSHSHGFSNPSWSGSASFTGTAMDFAVQYVDLIIASKD